MAKVIVQHHVADYDAWQPVFTEHSAVRIKHGATGHEVMRSVEDPNQVVIITDFASLDGARGFASDPSLREAMARGGVDSEPQAWIVEDAEAVTY
jgi:heme-degrading monooxygenase HmoA